jgi:UDP-N-acetyl-2-amino-2-deoxyglucuronate dehydrogenase
MTDQLVEHQMRFAVVGAGVIGSLPAQTITDLPGAEVGVVVDGQLERAQDPAGRHQARALSDIAAALSLPDIDAVAVWVRSGEHADLVVAALRAGKHVVVEKPLDVALAAARRVAVAERESGGWVSVISQHRFDPSALVVAEALSSGRLGRVTSGSASVPWWRSQAYYDWAGWRGTWALDGGGALMNQGIHTIDLLVWILAKARRGVRLHGTAGPRAPGGRGHRRGDDPFRRRRAGGHPRNNVCLPGSERPAADPCRPVQCGH